MSEEKEGADAQASAMPDTAGLAMDLAMEEARSDPSLRADVAAFLRDQRSLIEVQRKHLDDHLKEQLRQLRLGTWEKRFGVLLRVATAVVGLAFAGAVAAMIWGAAHSEGLIIESFSVPPDMAARGVTGQVVASQMLDKLTAMQDATSSFRYARSYANNWGNDIKVEIPQTGVSVSEIQHFLKNWLGHDTRISGEVYRTATGIAVTARSGSDTGVTFTGTDSDLDALVQRAAEHIYSRTQPYRYANYLDRNRNPIGLADRRARAAAIYHKLVLGPDPLERAWALNGLGSLRQSQRQRRAAIAYYRKSIAIRPDLPISYAALSFAERFGDNRESALAAFRTLSRLLQANSADGVNPAMLPGIRLNMATQIAMITGGFGEAARHARERAELQMVGAGIAVDYIAAQSDVLWAFAKQHDPSAVRAYMRELGISKLRDSINAPLTYAAMGDWDAVIALVNERGMDTLQPESAPALAQAMIHRGDIKGAEALIEKTPSDCDGCLLARAQFAEMRGQQGRADYWFARDVERTPSIPFANFEWGKVMLARGKPDDAIAQFTIANKKGPHFADPLEYWGEALMAKNQSHRALAKFAEAEKYAPNWGRLHLKWGEALAYSGDKTEAAKHFSRAAQLDLTPSERSELARQK